MSSIDFAGLFQPIEEACERLNEVRFPTLARPPIAAGSPPTRDLVDWGIQLYCFSILSHFREMLGSFILLRGKTHTPASFVIARCLLEMAAHSYYVHKHVTQYLDESNLQRAWDLLVEINMGNRYMQEIATERDGDEQVHQFRSPRHIAKVMNVFDEYVGKGNATKTYSFLSEFAHPNMATFSHYYRMNSSSSGEISVTFEESLFQGTLIPLGEVSASLVVVCIFSEKLLELTGERQVTSRLETIIAEHIDGNKRS